MSYTEQICPPEPPKKALCAFFLYRIDIYESIKEEHPNLRMTEITRIIGDMWKYLDPKLKQRYEQEYEINKKQVAAERMRYESEYGRQVRSAKSRKVKRALSSIRRFFDHGNIV
jgi:hypothetical protein